MKLLSKKEVQTLRSQAIDKSNLDKSKVDDALSKSIREFNEWKIQRSQEEGRIVQEFQNKINRYNAQIDDLVVEIAQLSKKRESQLIPVNKLFDEAKSKMKEVELKQIESEKVCKELNDISKRNKDDSDRLDKREKLLSKREKLIDNITKKTMKEKEAIKLGYEKLVKNRIEFEEYMLKENAKNNEKLDEIRIKNDEIKSQLAVNKEQKLQNMRDQAKLLSDRQALNSAWEELKKLKEKYDRR